MKTLERHVWQAQEYNENSEVQKSAAMELIDQLKLQGREILLDVGCGDGKITAALAKVLSNGKVYGIDISPEMIDFAKKRFLDDAKNLYFDLQKASNLDISETVDIVFSSFALQWEYQIEEFFERAYKHLQKDGKIACTIPLSISDELELALAELTKSPFWRSYFVDFELNYYLRSPKIYQNLLKQFDLDITYFEVEVQDWYFPNREAFEMYTLMWLPHLNALPSELQDKFFNQLMNRYVELVPERENGELGFNFSRLDFIATRKE